MTRREWIEYRLGVLMEHAQSSMWMLAERAEVRWDELAGVMGDPSDEAIARRIEEIQERRSPYEMALLDHSRIHELEMIMECAADTGSSRAY